MNHLPKKINLLDLTLQEIEALMKERGAPGFRAKQIYRQLYVNLTSSWADMSDLPQALRNEFEEDYALGTLEPVKVQVGDGGLTRKALFKLPEGETIESVLMIYPDRATVCVSSQAGCPMGCVFCATAKLGFLRDLTSGQMVEQVLWAAREVKRLAEGSAELAPGTDRLPRPKKMPPRLSNVVFMGMGEPFNNYDEWWASVERLHDSAGFNLGARSFTVSTVGLVPGIQQLTKEALPVNLAVSLHTADNALRSEMMPVNRAYPLEKLLEVTREYTEQTGRRVSFEYVLLDGKNDTPEEADSLATLLREGPMGDRLQMVHVNLIPWNPIPGTVLVRSSRNRVYAFQKELQSQGVPCTVRIERGTDIAAACGQLAGAAAE